MYESRRACPELVERGRHNAQPGWAIGLKSFISAPRELVPLRRQPINNQPESCSAKLASKHSRVTRKKAMRSANLDTSAWN